MVLLRKITLVSLIGMGLVTAGTIATAQRPVQLDSAPNSPVCPLRMHHQGRMGSGVMPMQMTSEFDYLSQMIPHHQEAIDTAKMVLERSDRPEMKEFAQAIVEVQSAEIEQMQTWLDEWYPEQSSTLSYTPMMRDLSQLRDELDQAFLEDMISHHHMAVMMSRMLVNHELVEHDAVYPFAEQIVTSQMNEIHQMQTWLREWFGTTGMMH
jgi:uncharacterized protein (DUF305 family)